MLSLTPNTIIKETVLRQFPQSKIYLFGSRYSGKNSIESDYDICIVVNESLDAKAKILYRSLLRKQLLKHQILSDIIIENKDEFNVKSQLSGHIIHEVAENSMVL